MMDTQERELGRIVLELLFGLMITLGTLLVAVRVAQLGAVDGGLLVYAALVRTGVNLVYRMLAGAASPGGRAMLDLMGMMSTIWAVKASSLYREEVRPWSR
ncbi:MAG: hypothetical protein HY271_10115 [Deltaproteobacteria bacterium]|nr:hypothetical protein [Deltaproteobacteria bacterium]